MFPIYYRQNSGVWTKRVWQGTVISNWTFSKNLSVWQAFLHLNAQLFMNLKIQTVTLDLHTIRYKASSIRLSRCWGLAVILLQIEWDSSERSRSLCEVCQQDADWHILWCCQLTISNWATHCRGCGSDTSNTSYSITNTERVRQRSRWSLTIGRGSQNVSIFFRLHGEKHSKNHAPIE